MEDLMSVDFEEPVDLVITDPCYIKGDDGNWPLNAVERLSKSYARPYFWAPLKNGLEDIGLTRSLMGNTVIGECRYGVFGRNGQIGEFSSNSCMFIVARMDEVIRAWSGFEKWFVGHCMHAALIRNFSGNVRVDVKRILYGWTDNDGHVNPGETMEISIAGVGEDGKDVFRTKRRDQTGNSYLSSPCFI